MLFVKLIFFFGFMIYSFLFMRQKKARVDSLKFKSQYGAFMTNLETYKNPGAVYYSFIFMLRRLFIAITINCFGQSIVLQILLVVHSSLALLSWLITVKPLESK